MESFIELLQYAWVQKALIASSMVGLMCGTLGVFIVLRNMSLIGDALSHSILPGVVFAYIIFGYSTISFFTGSVIAGLITAGGITWIQHNVKTKNDAAIGIVYTTMFSIGVIAISAISRSGGVHLDLKDFLFGNVLGVSNEDIYLTAGVMVYVLVSIVVFYRYLFTITFQPVIAETMGISVRTFHYFLMLLLSFAVVASIGTVGVILVVAMLITPAATALLLSDKLKEVIVISGVIGVLDCILGLMISFIFDTTPGPAIAIVAAFTYLMVVLFSPKKGLVFKYFRRIRLQRKIQFEDTLKQALKLHQKGNLTVDSLFDRLGFNRSILQQQLQRLKNKGLIQYSTNLLQLTDLGITEANKLVRAHRLWETYLVNQIGLTSEQIHEDAEKYEHLLTDEMLDEMDQALGYPTTDPHGSPIPVKK